MNEPTRSNEILDEWDAVTASARPPAVRMRRTITARSARLLPTLVAVAVVAVLAVAVGPRLASPAGEPAPSDPPEFWAALWWVDPAEPPSPDARVVRALLMEQACAGGRPPEGRVLPPRIEYQVDAVIVTYFVEPLGGRCPSNPAFPVEIQLAEPLGARALLDGSSNPPRSALVNPNTVTGPTIDCGPLTGTDVGKIECYAVLDAAIGDDHVDYAAITLQTYVPLCHASAPCTPLWGDRPPGYLVIGTDLEGRRRGWLCSYIDEQADCGVAPPSELVPRTTVAIHVVGAPLQRAVLAIEGGDEVWIFDVPDTGLAHQLPAGLYRLLTSDLPCTTQCEDGMEPAPVEAPPGWCELQFDAAAGARIDIVVTIAEGKPCRIEIE